MADPIFRVISSKPHLNASRDSDVGGTQSHYFSRKHFGKLVTGLPEHAI
jgi:hypothetical protein